MKNKYCITYPEMFLFITMSNSLYMNLFNYKRIFFHRLFKYFFKNGFALCLNLQHLLLYNTKPHHQHLLCFRVCVDRRGESRTSESGVSLQPASLNDYNCVTSALHPANTRLSLLCLR